MQNQPISELTTGTLVTGSETAMKDLLIEEKLHSKSVDNTISTLVEGATTTKGRKFWENQPVMQSNRGKSAYSGENGQIKHTWSEEELSDTPTPLPEGYEWFTIDMKDETAAMDVYQFLKQHYVEDKSGTFRFNYSIDFLKWALTPPGYMFNLHIGVRVSRTKRIYGMITGIPSCMSVFGKTERMIEINFLCVHKSLRGKRLGPVLIKEVTRRVGMWSNIRTAVYTSGSRISKPIGLVKYYHRLLNPKKLVETQYSRLPPGLTMMKFCRVHAVSTTTKIPRLREMVKKDVPFVRKLLNAFNNNTDLHPIYSEDEVAHWFLPIKGVITTYVIDDPTTSEVTDFASFYSLPSTINAENLEKPIHSILQSAFSFYNVATSVSLSTLMYDVITLAKKDGYDVFNCLNIAQNESFFKDLKFIEGDGKVHYYLYNWMCPEMDASKIGLVLV